MLPPDIIEKVLSEIGNGDDFSWIRLYVAEIRETENIPVAVFGNDSGEKEPRHFGSGGEFGGRRISNFHFSGPTGTDPTGRWNPFFSFVADGGYRTSFKRTVRSFSDSPRRSISSLSCEARPYPPA